MKLYKVIRNNQSCNGGNFDWTEYLPDGDTPGKWTPKVKDLDICHRGYHVTPYWNMWFEDGCSVYECEAKGLVERDDVGVIDKYVCESVRLTKLVVLNFDAKNNTGYWNTGNWNTGYRNTGDWNTGDWNTGDWNTGAFNTGEPKYYELFNKPIKRDAYNSIAWPDFFFFELKKDKTYQDAFIASFENASVEDVRMAVELPNFDYDVFAEISGITKEMIEAKLKE